MTTFVRFWINQPSTLQVGHAYHGKNVAATWEDAAAVADFVDVVNLDAADPCVSMRVPRMWLSKGTRP